jgi:hypothetical protein
MADEQEDMNQSILRCDFRLTFDPIGLKFEQIVSPPARAIHDAHEYQVELMLTRFSFKVNCAWYTVALWVGSFAECRSHACQTDRHEKRADSDEARDTMKQ